MSGLVGWLPLHETSGDTAHDLSGNGNHGTLDGGITQGVAGRQGLTAYSFDGEDDFIDLQTDTKEDDSLDLVNELTIAHWVKVDDGSYTVTRNTGGNTFQYGSNIGDGDSPRLRVDDEWYAEAEGAVTPGEWEFVAFTWDGAIVRTYVNGEEKENEELDGLLTRHSDRTIIGARNDDGSESFNYGGKLNDVRIYNRALSPSEVRELYHMGSRDLHKKSLSDGTDTGAVSRWKLSDGGADGSTALDSWGGNEGDINGSGWAFSDDSVRNKSLRLGDDHYVQVSHGGSLEEMEELTLSAWAKPVEDPESSHLRLISIWGEASVFQLFIANINNGNPVDGAPAFEVATEEGENWFSAGPKIADVSTWHHLVGVFDGSKMKIYLNGYFVGSEEHSGTVVSPGSQNLGIGAYENGDSNAFEGKIDDVRIYDRALESWEVFELYRWGSLGMDMRKELVNKKGGFQ